MRRELNGAFHRVNEPAKDNLNRLQGPVPLAEFLGRVRVLLPPVVGRVGWTKDIENAVEEDAAQPEPSLLAPLRQEHEIILVDVDRPERPLVPRPDTRRETRLGRRARCWHHCVGKVVEAVKGRPPLCPDVLVGAVGNGLRRCADVDFRF